MGLFKSIGKAFSSAANKVLDVGEAVGRTVSNIPIAKTAVNVLTGGVGGTALSLFSGAGTAVSTIFGRASDVPKLYAESARQHAEAFTTQESQAAAILAAREAAVSAVGSAFASAYQADLLYSDDLVFSAINKVTAGAKVAKFGFLKPRDQQTAGATTPLLYSSFAGTPFDFSTGTTTDLGNIGAISQRLQDDFKAFFTSSKSPLELNPVITVIDKLAKLGEGVDNPFDLYNFLGYEGPEVVQPMAKMNTPLSNAMLIRVARHGTTKSLMQWFGAARSYESAISTQRKVIADWLASSSGTDPLANFPAFLIDMLAFYVLKKWGMELLDYLYDKYASREVVASLSVAAFSSMHIYDKYDRLHYLFNAALVAFDRIHASYATAPSAEADCSKYMIASYHVVTLGYLLFMAKLLMPISNFGLDDGDITDLYNSLTGNDAYWGDLKLLCNHDNVDLLSVSKTDFAELMATAQMSCADMTILDDDDYIDSMEMERFVKDLEALLATSQSLTPVQAVDMKRVITTTMDALRSAIASNRTQDRARAANLIGRLQLGLSAIDSKIGA